jgi:glutathione synthase/RimK-type ligase-like ATP-grasp enzyme
MPLTKKPDGDFRVQSLFGGQYTLVQPTTTLIEKAQKIVNTFDHLLYARVDGIIINSELHLMELNVLNPIYISISAKCTGTL